MLVLALLLLQVGGPSACSQSTEPPADGGDGPVDGGSDGAVDGDGGPESCVGARQCRGNAVYACDSGKFGDEIEACTAPNAGCSRARCTSIACAAAESHPTGFSGCLFYAFEADNVASDAHLTASFLVTNPDPSGTASVVRERRELIPSVGVAWVPKGESAVGPTDSARFQLSDEQVVGAGPFPDAAIRLTSNLPVTVALIESDDEDQGMTSSSGGTMVLPIQALSVHYRPMTYPQAATPAVQDTAGGLGGAGRLAVVGTQPDTHVTLTLPPNAMAFTSADPTPSVPSSRRASPSTTAKSSRSTAPARASTCRAATSPRIGRSRCSPAT